MLPCEAEDVQGSDLSELSMLAGNGEDAKGAIFLDP